MKCAIATNAQLQAMGRWDAQHVIEALEKTPKGGDIRAASRAITVGRNKKGTGLLDLVQRAQLLLEEN